MITERKVSIYERYSGFVEAYIFENGDLPNEDFELMDWSLIDELVGNIILISSGNASIDFENQLRFFVRQNTENELVINHLGRIAREKKG